MHLRPALVLQKYLIVQVGSMEPNSQHTLHSWPRKSPILLQQGGVVDAQVLLAEAELVAAGLQHHAGQQLQPQPRVPGHHGQLLRRDELGPAVCAGRHEPQQVFCSHDGERVRRGGAVQRRDKNLPARRCRCCQAGHELLRPLDVLDDL